MPTLNKESNPTRLIVGAWNCADGVFDNSNRPTLCCFCLADISIVPVDEQLNYSELGVGGIHAPICKQCSDNGVWRKRHANTE